MAYFVIPLDTFQRLFNHQFVIKLQLQKQFFFQLPLEMGDKFSYWQISLH